MINVLITAAGGSAAQNCIDALSQQSQIQINLVTVDSDPLAAGLHRVGKSYVVPQAQSNDYWNRIEEICTLEKINVIIPTLYQEIILYSKEAPRLRSSGLHTILPSEETVDTFSSKWKQFQFFSKIGLRSPVTQHTSSPIDYTLYQGGAILKPEYGSGSRGFYRAETISEFKQLVGNLKSPYVVQNIVDYPEITVDILADSNFNIVAAVGRERLRVRNGMSLATRTIDISSVFEEIMLIVSQGHIVGPANIQYFADDRNGPIFFDVNTRFSAGGLPLATEVGINIPLMAVQLALGESISPKLDYPFNVTMIRYYNYLFFK